MAGICLIGRICGILHNRSERVCVVTVIGKSRQNGHLSKASILSDIINRDLFLASSLEGEKQNEHKIDIEGHYDSDNKVVFLHLRSLFDASIMADMCHRASEEIAQMGYHNFMQSAENHHAKAVLYLFCISHIILLVHPGNSFDVTYVRLFRVLDTIRVKLQGAMSDCLRGLGLPKDWVISGRLCSPRVLFIFERCTLLPTEMGDQMVMSKTRSQKTPPIKRLQHAIEDQIYRILRKSRIITNISNNSLFAVPANQEFVFVCTEKNPFNDPVLYCMGHLQRNCEAKAAETTRSHGYLANRRSAKSSSSSGSESSKFTSQTQKPLSTSYDPSEQNSFRDFLWQHIELAHSKGFDDNVGRNPVIAQFELPPVDSWFEASNKLYEFFLLDSPESRSQPHFNNLKSYLEIDGRFSEIRCAKILPMAEGTYRDGLPLYYTRTYHLNKLEQARQVFKQHARGPACDSYLLQLEEICDKIWQTDRQQCEERSLTGNPCVNQLHRMAEIPGLEANAEIPVMAHSSQVKTKSGCNCGNKQADREDPFDHRAANYEFYQKLDASCCSKYDHYTLPVFQPSTSDIKAGSGIKITNEPPCEEPETAAAPGHVTIRDSQRKDSSCKFELVHGMSNLSLALSLGQSGNDVYGNPVTPSFNQEGSMDQAEEHEDPLVTVEIEDNDLPEEPLSPLRQVSTTEYLPGMIHADSPTGLLPKFPSWSLLSIGKYASYSPNQGLDQPGFLHGGNFLLPWDVHIKVSQKEKWPVVGESPSSKKTKQTRKLQKDTGELCLRLYVGFEYECPRGHRFLMSGPDKIFKAPPTGIFKETANKVLSNDLPLYYPCHCRSPAKGFMGQLMRVFLAVPEGPIDVRINPRVRPHPTPCPWFFPTPDGAIPLISGLWALRLPYVYLGENGAYLMPTDSAALAACIISKGMISIQEDIS